MWLCASGGSFIIPSVGANPVTTNRVQIVELHHSTSAVSHDALAKGPEIDFLGNVPILLILPTAGPHGSLLG